MEFRRVLIRSAYFCRGGTPPSRVRAALLIFSTGLSISVRPSTGERGVSRRTVRIAIVLAGLAVVATSAEAQRRMRGGRAVLVDRPSVGPRIGYDFDADH